MDCSPPGSSVHGISQARNQSELPFLSPGGLPYQGIRLSISYRGRQSLYHQDTREAPNPERFAAKSVLTSAEPPWGWGSGDGADVHGSQPWLHTRKSRGFLTTHWWLSSTLEQLNWTFQGYFSHKHPRKAWQVIVTARAETYWWP